MHTSATAISVALLLSGALFISLWKSRSRRAKYRSLLPPGPNGLPWVGNVFDIDVSQPWVTYQEWGNRYGDLTYSQVLGKEYIIVNSEKVAHELLDQRSSIYSDRARVPSIELFDLGFVTPTLPYGEEWRKHRRALHLVLNKKEALKYATMQLQRAHGLLMNLLTTPQDFEEPFFALIMELAYGYSVVPQGDPFVASLVQLLSLVIEVVTPERSALLGAFPFLAHIPSWMPGGKWKKRAGNCRRLVRKVLNDPVQYVHDSIIAGTARKSMVHDIYLDKDDDLKLGFDKDKVTKEVAATAFMGEIISFYDFCIHISPSPKPGQKPTTSTIIVFLLAMVLHPDVQRKAQEEIDRVVGTDRLPDFGDRPNLPYVEAILLETLRWVSVVPLGVPHMTTAEDNYNGLRYYYSEYVDPERYTEPKVFNPDRYGSKLEDVASSPVFGFGRRLCPGRYLAEQSLWAVIVSMLATLQIGKATDVSGNEIEIHPKFVGGITIRPEAFPCSIKARSSRAKQLIRTSTTSAD
ncbi:cytochrome P450 [Pisolithus orientalis]|uniref:cytochrome P450 n=1 Tax=Pisolithus orientalis TaxID=936130 RepID=UPI0022258306|nr:cytochrome P450 [Pisolithus orientalis]KAI6010730.1 cytochrome P450 [Pisolithus orientalis]